jgi:glycosyltransferase involved in cell wall biosynthesis
VTTSKGLRVMAVGLRGIPDVQGGIETHAAELYPRMAGLGAHVTVVGRRRFRPHGTAIAWRGVRLLWLWSPRWQGLEAAVHTILGVLLATVRRPDILHVHGIGPAIALPIARLAGLHVVFTHHGQDYQREKWGAFARWVLRQGERWGLGLSHARIAISVSLRDQLQSAFGCQVAFIPNGIPDLTRAVDESLLARYELTPGRFIVQVSRLVPEKRQLDLIMAFDAARLEGWKLLLIGDGQGAEVYAESVRKATTTNPAIVCTGALPRAAVYALLSRAGLFVLPSSHEGLPIALLEAVRLQVPALASDISGNREVGLDPSAYFSVGDTVALAAKLENLAASESARQLILRGYPDICTRYNWEEIAAATLTLMEKAARKRRLVTD